ncbi:hypothetical protein CMI47_20855 [Candidatus Pacearchaeota archaeon]|jgi:hypothetical protein|nr:hypothetical protein [Candidatus Pacearchaeota archaeon]|tara:strand:+ start:10695 stop:11186 length:492 start_codon:yes stop_codon:yes gene_type:complete
MAIATTPDKTTDVILEEDKELEAEDQTIFKVRVLSVEKVNGELIPAQQKAAEDFQKPFREAMRLRQQLEEMDEDDPDFEEKSEELMSQAGSVSATEVFTPFYTSLIEKYLMGWENFKAPDGQDIPFMTGTTAERLSLLSVRQRADLGKKIIEANTLTGEDRKN